LEDYLEGEQRLGHTRSSIRQRLLLGLAALAAITTPAVVHAGELPDDIWSGRHGGVPSITASAQDGVSMTLPARAVEEAGGGSIAQFAQNFLDKWAPDLCSGAFDFQSAHKGLKVGVALMKPAGRTVLDGQPAELYEVTTYSDVLIDYEPNRKVTCVNPPDLSS
jgi:hypothetical protein